MSPITPSARLAGAEGSCASGACCVMRRLACRIAADHKDRNGFHLRMYKAVHLAEIDLLEARHGLGLAHAAFHKSAVTHARASPYSLCRSCRYSTAPKTVDKPLLKRIGCATARLCLWCVCCCRALVRGAAACGKWEDAIYWLQELINNQVTTVITVILIILNMFCDMLFC